MVHITYTNYGHILALTLCVIPLPLTLQQVLKIMVHDLLLHCIVNNMFTDTTLPLSIGPMPPPVTAPTPDLSPINNDKGVLPLM